MNKAILINAKNKTITEISVGDYKDIQRQGGYDIFTCVRLDKGETIYVDDEGMINGTDFGFAFDAERDGNPMLLWGNGIILGSNDEGDSIDTALSVDEIAKLVRFREGIATNL